MVLINNYILNALSIANESCAGKGFVSFLKRKLVQ